MKEIQEYQEQIFERIKHIDEEGNEYWLARELQTTLQYTEWRKFYGVIKKAMMACNASNYPILEHFVGADKTSEMPNGGNKKIIDYKLSRYACYLIVQNADPRKKSVALGQTYFAVQTRKMEITEDYFQRYQNMSEDEKRILKRKEIRTGNYELYHTAKTAGVKNFDKFTNSGYKGLYNGETADDIAKRKKLRYREDILDNMCSDELIANQFRISLTNQKLKKENTQGEKEASDVHYEMGSLVRDTIIKAGTTLPEDFETPEKSLKEINKENLKKIKGGCICFIKKYKLFIKNN